MNTRYPGDRRTADTSGDGRPPRQQRSLRQCSWRAVRLRRIVIVDRLEAPDFRDSTAIEFTRSQLREVAADLYRWIAVDPPHETKFYPVDVESFFDDESREKASWN